MEKIVWGKVMDIVFMMIFIILGCIAFKKSIFIAVLCIFFFGIVLYGHILTNHNRKKWNNGISKKTGLPWKAEFADSANCTSLVSGPNSQGEMDYMSIHFGLELSKEERKKIKF